MNWILDNYIEILGVIFGFIYIFLSIKQNVWLWPIGIINATLYVWVFLMSKLYADMSLQIYYLLISIYGWYYWVSGKNVKQKDNKNLPITRTNAKTFVVLLILEILLFSTLWFVLKNFTDSTVPAGDAFATSLSILATWMLTKKKIEQWLIWIVVNIFSVGLFYYKELYATVILYSVFALLASVGYIKWHKELKLSENAANN
jgi:nicotinamide mononucleotide transporter